MKDLILKAVDFTPAAPGRLMWSALRFAFSDLDVVTSPSCITAALLSLVASFPGGCESYLRFISDRKSAQSQKIVFTRCDTQTLWRSVLPISEDRFVCINIQRVGAQTMRCCASYIGSNCVNAVWTGL